MNQPSIGRIVHYVSYGSPGGEFPARACRAAMVTEIGLPLAGNSPNEDEYIGLAVYNPSGMWFNRGVKHDEDKAPGTWHWPERTE